MRSFLFLILLLIPFVLMGKDEFPQSVKSELDKQFPGWKIRPKHFPNPCDINGTDTTSFEPQLECDLNGDDIPDYAIGIITGNDSTLVSIFLPPYQLIEITRYSLLRVRRLFKERGNDISR